MTRANSPNPSAFMRQDHTPDARLCNHIAWSARWRDRKFSIEAATKALSRADAPDGLDPVEAGLALRTLAWQATWKGQFAAAEDYAGRAILFLEESDSWAALVDAHVAKATIHLTRFRMDLAKEDLQIARQIVARDRRPDTLVNLLCTETILLRIYRADDEAYACLTEAMHHASGNEEARVLHQLARFYVYVDNHGEAIAKAKLAVVSARRWNNRVILPYTLEYHGSLLAASGHREYARACLGEALELARSDKDMRAECFVLTRLGELDALEGNLESAAGRLGVARRKTEQLGLPFWEQRVLSSLASVLEQKGEYRGAFEALKAYRSVVEAARF